MEFDIITDPAGKSHKAAIKFRGIFYSPLVLVCRDRSQRSRTYVWLYAGETYETAIMQKKVAKVRRNNKAYKLPVDWGRLHRHNVHGKPGDVFTM